MFPRPWKSLAPTADKFSFSCPRAERSGGVFLPGDCPVGRDRLFRHSGGGFLCSDAKEPKIAGGGHDETSAYPPCLICCPPPDPRRKRHSPIRTGTKVAPQQAHGWLERKSNCMWAGRQPNRRLHSPVTTAPDARNIPRRRAACLESGVRSV